MKRACAFGEGGKGGSPTAIKTPHASKTPHAAKTPRAAKKPHMDVASAAPDKCPDLPGFECLPSELQLRVAGYLDGPEHQAALCLAIPPLGRRAIKALPSYQGPLLSVALRLVGAPATQFRGARTRSRSAAASKVSELIDPDLLRRYARDRRATDAGCGWLARMAHRGEDSNYIEVKPRRDSPRLNAWYLRCGQQLPLAIRVAYSNGSVGHLEGEHGQERLVRQDWPDGNHFYYEGIRNRERQVRLDWPDGVREHFEGGRGSERLVRVEWPNGRTKHYKGEGGNERLVRVESPHDIHVITHFEGEKGSERKVRTEFADGRIVFYKR